MKFACHCGATVFDHGGEQTHKAHVIPDEDWLGILEAIDSAIENTVPAADAREAACMHIRTLLGKLSSPAWQCTQCGRIYLHDASDDLHAFAPELQSAPARQFASRTHRPRLP